MNRCLFSKFDITVYDFSGLGFRFHYDESECKISYQLFSYSFCKPNMIESSFVQNEMRNESCDQSIAILNWKTGYEKRWVADEAIHSRVLQTKVRILDKTKMEELANYINAIDFLEDNYGYRENDSDKRIFFEGITNSAIPYIRREALFNNSVISPAERLYHYLVESIFKNALPMK